LTLKWLQQSEAIARATNCYAELTTEFAGIPPPRTVEAFICEARFSTTWRILHGTISGPTWAYMRVLGFAPFGSPDPPMPASAYRFAEMAARRMNIPGTAEQPPGEKDAMVLQATQSTKHHYPSEKHFNTGIRWLRGSTQLPVFRVARYDSFGRRKTSVSCRIRTFLLSAPLRMHKAETESRCCSSQQPHQEGRP